MHLRVTIGAAAAEQVRARRATGQSPGRIGNGWVTRAFVAGLAKEWSPHFQQRRLCRSVRLVTGAAVLRHRLVFPQKRSAVFSMTTRAGLIHGALDQLRRSRRTVGRMTVGASHLALAHRMM